MDEIRRLRRGMTVSDVSDRPLGRVGSVSDEMFQVDIPDDGTVWLHEDALFWVGNRGATLVCEASRVHDYEGER